MDSGPAFNSYGGSAVEQQQLVEESTSIFIQLKPRWFPILFYCKESFKAVLQNMLGGEHGNSSPVLSMDIVFRFPYRSLSCGENVFSVRRIA